MTRQEWDILCARVTDEMKVFTRPFVTPLIHEPFEREEIVGSGSYVDFGSPHLVTCEHVACYQPQSHRPLGSNLQILQGKLHMERHPVDAALVKLDVAQWPSIAHDAELISPSMFADRHEPVEGELLFFRGVSGENVHVGHGWSDITLSGYCSQEKKGSGDAELFEIFWEPEHTQLTPGTGEDVRGKVKFQDARGMSGSLVWNTRFVESGCDLRTWSPEVATVTGLLRRWDTKTRTLLAWRVEHLNAWITKSLPV